MTEVAALAVVQRESGGELELVGNEQSDHVLIF
jgi:hypothetical protein